MLKAYKNGHNPLQLCKDIIITDTNMGNEEVEQIVFVDKKKKEIAQIVGLAGWKNLSSLILSIYYKMKGVTKSMLKGVDI